jgi:3,4-dihydroxy 2-butanone 4-phosphate synthase/GTP cyclohydrolase II
MTSERTPVLSSTLEIIADMRAGKMVILVDEEDRENEGDLVLAADHVSAEAINFMARFGRGLICLTLTREHCAQLKLPLMVRDNGTSMGTNFTVSIEAATGVTTGISAADRAHTIKTAVAKNAGPSDIVQPGHIFPLMAQPGGVLVRSGHTEAGCDLAGLAGCTPASVICEIMKDDGTMARLPDLIEFAKEHHIKIGTIVDLIKYRSQNESMVQQIGQKTFTTVWGDFLGTLYRDAPNQNLHLALTKGAPQANGVTLVRVHEPSLILDFLDQSGSLHSWPLAKALKTIAASECGVAVLLNVDSEKSLSALWLSEFEPPKTSTEMTSPAMRKHDFRTYGIGAQILRDQGVGKMRLMNKPGPLSGMSAYQLEVVGYLESE